MATEENLKIAVVGSTGMLGHKVSEMLLRTGFEPVDVPEDQVDIRDYRAMESAILDIRPAAVVNCAAITNVDGCETNSELAFAVNAEGAGHVARAAMVAHATLVHISSDYVFDGRTKVPYVETDAMNPQGVYANSKWAGEKAVARERVDHFIIRTSWLFGSGGNNFVDTILRLAATRDSINVVNDQFGSPTYSVHLAGAICRILRIYLVEGYGKAGIYHIANDGYCSWNEFAKKIIEMRPELRCVVNPVSTYEYFKNWDKPFSPRPPYSVLNKDKVKKTFGIALPHWEDALAEYLASKEQ